MYGDKFVTNFKHIYMFKNRNSIYTENPIFFSQMSLYVSRCMKFLEFAVIEFLELVSHNVIER